MDQNKIGSIVHPKNEFKNLQNANFFQVKTCIFRTWWWVNEGPGDICNMLILTLTLTLTLKLESNVTPRVILRNISISPCYM